MEHNRLYSSNRTEGIRREDKANPDLLDPPPPTADLQAGDDRCKAVAQVSKRARVIKCLEQIYELGLLVVPGAPKEKNL